MTTTPAPTASIFRQREPIVTQRLLHLDLKGLPPTPNRFRRLLQIAAAAGYNQILIEWEDTFPWTVDTRFRGETFYSPADIQAFHQEARLHGLELIPLVQCLGHMETPLQLPEYAHLREEPHLNMSLNPLAPGATDLIRDMVDDVLALMPDSRYLHLGGDESWSFGKHPDTAAYIAKHGKAALYLHFLEPLLDHLHSHGLRAILWHDMMREWPRDALNQLGERADLMIWGYRGTPWDTPQHHFTTKVLDHLTTAEIPLWGAGAFKCGSLDGASRVDLQARTDNMQGWVRAARAYGLVGVCATGWSRNTTADVQYAPIDANLDMMIRAGFILHDGEPPDTDCLARLLGEAETEAFRQRAAAVEHFDAVCDARWQSIRYLRQFIANFQADPTRRPGSMEELTLQNLLSGHVDLQAAADALPPHFVDLVDACWIERLCQARLIGISHEIEHLRADWPSR